MEKCAGLFALRPFNGFYQGESSAESRKVSKGLATIFSAFAVVAMAPMKELGVAHERLNVHGGACALGHPIGASGARIVVTLIHALRQRGGKRGVAALCIGGGEATALAIELV